MQKRWINFSFYLVLALTAINCANRGSIGGGPKDVTPPEIIKTVPENYSTNFTANEIRIYFNEYVKVKNLQKQLIISPPMNTQPEVTPLSSASEYIKIKIFDTLKPNTTYAFNFGNSIVDNNEENPYEYYRYVFSTGDYIDSLNVKGSVIDALNRTTESFISVHLYEVDSTYTDSIIYKEKPKYVTNTLDSTTNFTIENLKAGTYRLIALKDNNNNNLYEQKSDKIGFFEDYITVPDTSANYQLKVFKEDLDYKAFKPRLVAGEKIAFGYQGDYTKTKIDVLSKVPEDFKFRIVKEQDTDTLNYFYYPKLEDTDSLIFKVQNDKIIDTFTVKLKDNLKDSLNLRAEPINTIAINESFKLKANIPITKVNKDNISIMDKDSVFIDFDTKLDTLLNHLEIKFAKEDKSQYKITILPETVTDFFENTNDSLNYNLQTPDPDALGEARVLVKNATYPILVQLVNDKSEVKYEKYSTKPEPLDFFYVKPGKYYLRVVFDSNKNGKYDTGDFLRKIQPERVSYRKKEVEIRVGWSNIEEFILN